MENFLEKFVGTIENRQVQQILKLLNKKRSQGSIQNLEQFKDNFQKLIQDLTSGDSISPTLTFIPAIPSKKTSSEEYNDMLSQVSDDLSASFEELIKIEEVQINHEEMVSGVRFKDLRSGMNELVTKINLYKLVNSNENSFENGIYSTFNETKQGRTSRGSDIPDKLFVDPKTNKVIPSKYDAEIDLVGDQLTLGFSQSTVGISSITEKTGDDFKESVYSLNNETEYNINNIIDSKKGTFWKKIIRRLAQDETVKTKLELKLNGIREIDYIEIDPDNSEFVLEKVDFLDKEENVRPILEASKAMVIKEETKILFSKISTDTIILEFKIVNSEQRSYENFETKNFNPLNEYVPPSVQEEVLQAATDTSNPFSCFEYKIGIDNIRVGLTSYKETGIYVSSAMLLKEETGTLGLMVKEKRPYMDNSGAYSIIKYTDTFDSTKEYLGSLEYWIVKEDLDSDDENANIISTNVFPIYPMNRAQIFHERLILTEASSGFLNNTGYLMHYPDITEDITVYRNGKDDEYQNTITQTENLPLNGYRMRYKIEIPNANPGDVFTVSYTPLKANSYSNSWSSASKIEQVDLTGDLTARTGPEGLVILDESQDERIESYRIYLIAVLRQNSAQKEITPILEEYTLAVGKRNLNKFEET